jgi:hypothetical protein
VESTRLIAFLTSATAKKGQPYGGCPQKHRRKVLGAGSDHGHGVEVFVRTVAATETTGAITVETKQPELGWKVVLNKPVVDGLVAADLLAVLATTAVLVLDAQEHRFPFSAALALATVCGHNNGADAPVVFAGCNSSSLWVLLEVSRHAFGKDLRAAGAAPIHFSIFSYFELSGRLGLFADGTGFSFDFHDSE